MASRNGLNPKIRSPKGVGHGRALPAPFGFGNGISPGGTGFLNIPFLERNVLFPDEITIEWWVDTSENYDSSYRCIFCVADTVNSKFLNSDNYGIAVQGSASGNIGYVFTGPYSVPLNTLVHVIFTHKMNSTPNSGNTNIYLNGLLSTSASSLLSAPFNINRFLIFANVASLNTQNQYWLCKSDEIRIYNKVLSPTEASLNYNAGLGSNPANTESLLAWYQFEQFENLDFSFTQDGSDIGVGIRDMSGNNNHCKANGFDVDPLSSYYVLEPF